jgi:acetyl-CoA carboxylase biotin carboxyl carrier protein
MELSDDDVLHILKLIDESKFDYFQLELGDLKITVSKGEPIPISSMTPGVAAPHVSNTPPVQTPKVSTPEIAPAPQAHPPKSEIKAPAIPAGLLRSLKIRRSDSSK